MPSPATLLVALLAGVLGTAYFVYGKRQQRGLFMVAGIALCVYPYVVGGWVPELVVGVLIAAAPFLVRD